MSALPYPDHFHLSAASGWLDLGCPLEAVDELSKIQESSQLRPEVLEIRSNVAAKQKNWEQCLQLSRQVTGLAPERPAGWINGANALFFMGRSMEAFEFLHLQSALFPKNEIIPYNLACYCCATGKLDAARHWLARAFGVAEENGVKEAMRRMALEDRDLQVLWPELLGSPSWP